MDTATLRLKALAGRPLADTKVRSIVLAMARAIAERTGATIADMSANDSSITVTINVNKLEALGFMAELRRLTNEWYEKKYECGPLWGTPVTGHDDL